MFVKLRFSLKTFLLLVFAVALVAGFYGYRIRGLAQERQGLEELGEDWSVSVNRHVPGANEPATGIRRVLYDLPIAFCLGRPPKSDGRYVATNRVRSLRLFTSENSERSLSGLNRFNHLEYLSFIWSPGVGNQITINEEEFRKIGKLQKLTKLKISRCETPTNALGVLSELNLKDLTCGTSNWTEAELEQIGRIKTLENLNLFYKVSNLSLIHI